MKLTDLNAQLFYRAPDGVMRPVAQVDRASGVQFECPLCAGTELAHDILCWFRGRVPDDLLPGPGRWHPSGRYVTDLTLSPSVNLTAAGGCRWHGWVVAGEATEA